MIKEKKIHGIFMGISEQRGSGYNDGFGCHRFTCNIERLVEK